MKSPTEHFKTDQTYLPVTMKQFEDLTNEILTAINEHAAPHFLSSDYIAQVLMSAIHAMDHKIGVVNKSDLFVSCVNRISCHITYDIVRDIQQKLAAKPDPTLEGAPPTQLASVIPIVDTNESAV